MARDVLAPQDQEVTLTNLIANLANKSKGQEWIEFFDILLGSLMALLRRIFVIHTVIMDAITTANDINDKADAIVIPDQQLSAIKATSQEVLINVCDQVVTFTLVHNFCHIHY